MKYPSDKVYESAINACKSIVSMDNVLDVHKKELLSSIIWKITERNGKFNTDYVSLEAKKILGSNKTQKEKRKLLAHEHVFTRKYLIDQLLAKPAQYKKILSQAIGCVVTREEHIRLETIKNSEGWDRYEKAHIYYERNSQIKT